MIVDTHVHVASHDTDQYPMHPLRAGGSEWWRNPVSAEDLLKVMDSHGVARAVLIHALGAYSYDCSYTVEAARIDPERLCAVVAVNMAGPDPASELEALVDPVVRGVRLLSMGPGDTGWHEEPKSQLVWRTAGEAGLSVIVMGGEAQLAAFRPAIASEPGVVTVIDHCGMPDLEDAALRSASPLLGLADLPNVWVKISTPVLLAGAAQGSETRLVNQLVDHFGPDRVVWGSDFPQTVQLDYAGKLDLGARATAELSEDEREAILAGNAASLWFTPGSGPGPDRPAA